MNEKDLTTADSLRAIGQQLKEHRLLLGVTLPVCLVGCYLLLLLVPSRYASSFSVVCESQQAIDGNRVMTFNLAENYDLGLTATDNAVNEYGLEQLALSPSVLLPLLGKQVQTQDSSFEGTVYEYLARFGGLRTKSSAEVNLPDEGSLALSRKQARVLTSLRRSISTKIDTRGRILTVEVVTRDPLVSATLAALLEQEMRRAVNDYQMEKMQVALDHLNTLAAEADRELAEAIGQKAADVARKQQVSESFHRQQLLCAAQKMYRPAFFTLSSPVVEYRVVSPHRTITSVLVTMVLGLLLGLWVCRKEVMDAI